MRVEGKAERVSQEESEQYFASRPRGSQLGAWASPQSRVVACRDELDRRYAEVEDRFDGFRRPPPGARGAASASYPRSSSSGRAASGRMHDRLVYRREGEGWGTVRLAP